MSAKTMEIDLAGQTFRLIGEQGEAGDAIAAALAANGARVAAEGELADLLLVAYPLLPQEGGEDQFVMLAAREAGRAMLARGSGRIVFLLSAMAALPMRRYLDYSIAMAAALAGVRGLAMQLAPVLVNAVGAGVIEDAGGLLAGDRQMLSHAGLDHPGSLEDVVNAVLFLCDPLNSYTTGQMLTVDGGWSVGYGRNF